MPVKHKGAASELGAAVWLLQQGYEVFRNVSQHGDTDIIALRAGELLRIDVKTATSRTLADGSIKFYASGKATNRDIRILLAYPDGSFAFEEVQDALP